MTSELRQRARPVFMEVADLPEGERSGAVERLCGSDAALKSEVLALLSAAASAGSFLGSPERAHEGGLQGVHEAPPTILLRHLPGEYEGQSIGRYKLLQSIGAGGFGTVWMAEQREPVKRRVALKIIKLGMDTRQVIARFETERQALAMMDHPNIARVFDAGFTDAGRPYFVMEYIKGVPLMEYCTSTKLSVREKLDLFTRVCHAIQHAHQKGVIHRDIKPGNVLVTMHDGVPVPKVIDFGIAKATGAELTQKTLFTEHRQMIGTPAYMSPEQAEMSGLDVDTRSDIYSLGVLLYEMLTGTTPFDSNELLSKGFAEMVRMLREVEPVRPSTRLSTLSLNAMPAPANQRAAGKGGRGGIHGDLDWIVMRCLEKDRNRRYDSAAALAADVQRHLADEPVSAGPPGAGYRMRKFVRRHRVQVIAASLVAATLVLGVVGTSIGLVYAVGAATAERAARDDAERRRVESETNLAFARKGNAILGSVFEALDPDAQYATVADLRNALRENLGRAVQEIDSGSIGDDLDVASMQHTLGISLLQLGEGARAVVVLEKAVAIREARLGPAAPETLRTKHVLASALSSAGFDAKAIAMEEQLHPLRVRSLGPDHPDTLSGMYWLATLYAANTSIDKGIQLAEEAARLAAASTRAEKIDPLENTYYLAQLYAMAGKHAQALPLYEQCAKLEEERHGRTHSTTLDALACLADAKAKVGDDAGAVAAYEEVLSLQRDRLGRDHPNTLLTMGNLANAYLRVGRPADAALLYEETYKLRQVMLGATHPQTIGALSHLASAYSQAGKAPEAIVLIEQMVELNREKFGPTHQDTINGMFRLADARMAARQFDKAAEVLANVVEARRSSLGPNHPDTLGAVARHGEAQFLLGDFEAAERTLTSAFEGLKAREADLTTTQRELLTLAIKRLTELCERTGRHDAAAAWKARLPR